jgi:stage V sporulation protein SpoVS
VKPGRGHRLQALGSKLSRPRCVLILFWPGSVFLGRVPCWLTEERFTAVKGTGIVKQRKDKAAVIKGVLYPSGKDIQTIVASLQRKLKTDPKTAERFKKNPRRMLAAFGLNEDLQRELLGEMGLKTSTTLEWCVCTDCCNTCWCTGCCITEINITRVIE